MRTRLPEVGPEIRSEFQQSRWVLIPDVLPQTVIERWRAQALLLAERFSRRIARVEGGHVLSYRVVTGEAIRQAWPEVWEFYAAPETLEWMAAIANETCLYTSSHIQSAVNLNVLDEPGSVYRWHYDAVPYTAILFLTDTDQEAGGILEVVPGHHAHEGRGQQQPGGGVMRVVARAGSMVLMDGSVCHHRVTELRRKHMRLTIPMVYPATTEHRRPSKLDQYLYDGSN